MIGLFADAIALLIIISIFESDAWEDFALIILAALFVTVSDFVIVSFIFPRIGILAFPLIFVATGAILTQMFKFTFKKAMIVTSVFFTYKIVFSLIMHAALS